MKRIFFLIALLSLTGCPETPQPPEPTVEISEKVLENNQLIKINANYFMRTGTTIVEGRKFAVFLTSDGIAIYPLEYPK